MPTAALVVNIERRTGRGPRGYAATAGPGGAGGIGMLAGMSRMFPFRAYLILVAAATLPLPLFLLLGM